MKHRIAPLFLIVVLNNCFASDMGQAVHSYGTKNFLKTHEIASREIKQSPNDPLVLTLHGWSQFQLGKLNSALKVFKKLQKNHSTNFHGYLGEAWVLIKHGKLKRADKIMDKAERWAARHQYTMLRASRGWIAYHRNNLAEAERWFIQAEQDLLLANMQYYHINGSIQDSWSAMPLVGMGWVEVAWGNMSGAKKAFRKALIRDSNCHLCYSGLAYIEEMKNNISQAINYTNRGLKICRNDPELTQQLNRLHKRTGYSN